MSEPTRLLKVISVADFSDLSIPVCLFLIKNVIYAMFFELLCKHCIDYIFEHTKHVDQSCFHFKPHQDEFNYQLSLYPSCPFRGNRKHSAECHHWCSGYVQMIFAIYVYVNSIDTQDYG